MADRSVEVPKIDQPSQEFIQEFSRVENGIRDGRIFVPKKDFNKAVETQLEQQGIKGVISEIDGVASTLNHLEVFATLLINFRGTSSLSEQDLRDVDLLTRDRISELSCKLQDYLNQEP